MNASSDRILTVICCDDIRHEVGNKMSFMGCYQDALYVQEAPMALPRLCFFITALTPSARPFKWLTLKLMQDETTELARMEIPSESLINLPDAQDDRASRQSVSTAMVFSPFIIEKPTVLRVLADTEEGEIIGPLLHIKVGPGIGPTDTAPTLQ